MKKNNLLLLLLAVLAGIAAIVIMKRNDSSTIRQELMDFAVKDTAGITKIFLADRNGNSVLLTRAKGQNWMLNDSLRPRPDMMKNLMEVIYSVSVKSRVPKAGFNNVISALASGGIKVEIYSNDQSKAVKVYYVGGQTADALGTFMMIENSSVPFVTEIPGFNGYLSPWYNPNSTDWTDPVLFNYEINQIKTLSILYPAFPDRSFSLQRNGDQFILRSGENFRQEEKTDSIAVENYLSMYRMVYYEVKEGLMTRFQKDSLLAGTDISEIEIEGTDGTKKGIRVFPMPINEASITVQDSLGNPLKYDVDRMYAYLVHRGEWVVIQHFSFDKLFRMADDFRLKKRKSQLPVRN